VWGVEGECSPSPSGPPPAPADTGEVTVVR
jgi:hypothetical protein